MIEGGVRPKVHHLGAALQGIADCHADVLNPRQIEALYQSAERLWGDDPAPSDQEKLDYPAIFSEIREQGLRDLVGELVEALEPFARAAPNIPPRFDDDRSVCSEITLRDGEGSLSPQPGEKALALIVSLDGIDVADYRRAAILVNRAKQSK